MGQTAGKTQAGMFAQIRTLGTTGSPLVWNTGVVEALYAFNQLGGTTIQGGAVVDGINQATTLAGNMIVTSGQFAGVDINIAGTGTITNNGTSAALLIRSSGTPVWPVGIQIAPAGAIVDMTLSGTPQIFSGAATTRAAVESQAGCSTAPIGSVYIGLANTATTKPNMFIKVTSSTWERVVTQNSD